MPIICPHCATSYAVDPSAFGPQGRTVRCARCKETWVAMPDGTVGSSARTMAPAFSAGERPVPPAEDSGWGDVGFDSDFESPPHVESPSIASDAPTDADWGIETPGGGTVIDAQADETPVHAPTRRRPTKPARRKSAARPLRAASLFNLTTGCAAMAALLACLFIWRAEMVRLMPQTASYYKILGLDVNLRQLAFKDVKLSSETVDGKPVLVIEGHVVASGAKPVDIPRLRFIVRDAKGAEIYAWNAVLDQPQLQPGDRVPFKSRLAAPPPEGQTLDIRFFNSRDVAAGTA
jgi:predicted Zn finger-like uncharacterized protein